MRCEHVDHFVHMARLLGIPVPECTLVRGLKDGEPGDSLHPPRTVTQFERALSGPSSGWRAAAQPSGKMTTARASGLRILGQ